MFEERGPVVQLYSAVLTATGEPQYVVLAVVHFELQFADWLARQTHVVDDIQRAVNLRSKTTARVVFVVETSEGDNFATKRIFTLEMVHFGEFSVAKGLQWRGHVPVRYHRPNTTLVADTHRPILLVSHSLSAAIVQFSSSLSYHIIINNSTPVGV